MYSHIDLSIGLTEPVDRETLMRVINKVRAMIHDDTTSVQYLRINNLSNELQPTLEGGD